MFVYVYVKKIKIMPRVVNLINRVLFFPAKRLFNFLLLSLTLSERL